MITKFKIFESISKLPKEGDYVIVNPKCGYGDKILTKFYNENIGKIIKRKGQNWYDVEFSKDNIFSINYIEISGFECWSSDKEELEMLLNSKKYNL